MYRPSPEKYLAQVDGWLSDPEVRCLGAFEEDRLTGILAIRAGEILGVAVRQDVRGQGVGRALILRALQYFLTLTAETDADSVDFYRRCSFACEPFERSFPDGRCIRFRCVLNA